MAACFINNKQVKNPSSDAGSFNLFKTLQFISGRDLISREQPRPIEQIDTYYGRPGIYSLNEMLKSQNIIVYPEDAIQVFPEPSFGLGSKIMVSRATPVKIIDGENQTVCRTWKTTIADLFAEKGVQIGKDDKVEPSLTQTVYKDLQIKITRVSETEISENLPVQYKTINKENPNLEKGKTSIASKGVLGQEEKVYKVRRENGVEISRILIKTEIVVQPKDRVYIVGTKVIVYGTGVASIWKEGGDMIAACNLVPKGTKLNVVNPNNGKSVVVTSMGSGLRSDRAIDLSSAAFIALGGSWSQGLLYNIRVEKYYP